MSSLVKKGSQFAPKLKNPVRKKATPKPTATPEPSQNVPPSGSDAPPPSKSTSDQLNTPPATQVDKPRSSFSIKGASSKKGALSEEVVDPIDSSKPQESSAIADSSDEDEETLKQHAQILRRASSRRLSGINPGFRSRSASVSHRPGSEDNQSSARIIIPQPKSTKRRRSSVGLRNQKRASMGVPNVATAPALKPSSAVTSSTVPPVRHSPSPSSSTSTTSRILNSNVSHLFPALRNSAAPLSKIMNDTESEPPAAAAVEKTKADRVSKEFVVGIDPRTNKLRKFRRRDAPKSEVKEETEGGFTRVADKSLDDLIPIAPENLITTVTNISQIPSGIKEEDLELYGELDFDYDGMTVADLCKPTLKIGSVSSSFKLAQEAEAQLKQKKVQRRLDRIRARQERISLEEATLKNEGKTDEEILLEKEGKKPKSGTDLLNLEEDEGPSMSSALQLTLVDGKIGYSEESAVVVKPRADASGRTVEDSNPFANPVTSTTYSKRTYTDKWTPDELNEFYQALSMFGTDFSLIAQLYPHRTRKQIKSKFVLEERKYPEVIELALKRKLPVDFKKYCDATNNEIKTIEQYNEELKKVRIEHEQSMNAIAIEREKAFKEDAEANRRREIEIRTGFTGSKSMTTAERRKELRKNETVVGTIDDIKNR